MRPVPQRSGGIKFEVNQQDNPETITLRTGGLFRDCLIAGQVGTISIDPSSLALFRAFGKELRSQFTKIKSYYFGQEAAEWLDNGFRLTSGAKTPPLYDLKRD